MTDISFDTCTCGSVVVSDAQAVAELKANNERLRAALQLAYDELAYAMPLEIFNCARAALEASDEE